MQKSHAEVHPRAALPLNALIHHTFILYLEGTRSWYSRRDHSSPPSRFYPAQPSFHRINIHISQSVQCRNRMYNVFSSSSVLITSLNGGRAILWWVFVQVHIWACRGLFPS